MKTPKPHNETHAVLVYLVLLVMACFMLSSCGRQEAVEAFYSDPAFTPYVDSFQSDSIKLKGKTQDLNNLKVIFSVENELLSKGLAGFCMMDVYGKKTVKIEPIVWYRSGEIDRMAIVYHELGHCVLNRDHRNDLIPNGTAYASIMNIYAQIDASLKDYYVRELFR